MRLLRRGSVQVDLPRYRRLMRRRRQVEVNQQAGVAWPVRLLAVPAFADWDLKIVEAASRLCPVRLEQTGTSGGQMKFRSGDLNADAGYETPGDGRIND